MDFYKDISHFKRKVLASLFAYTSVGPKSVTVDKVKMVCGRKEYALLLLATPDEVGDEFFSNLQFSGPTGICTLYGLTVSWDLNKDFFEMTCV